MSKKNPEIDPNHQGQLLALVGEEAVIPEEIFPQDPREKLLGRPSSYEVVYGPEGSWKDLKERSEQLLFATAAFSLRNQRMGLPIATHDYRHNSPIYGRYRSAVPQVLSGAKRNATRTFLDEARTGFWEGSGFVAMRNNKTINKRQLDARAIIMWEKFFARFGTPVDDEDRKNYQRRDFQKRLLAVIAMTEEVEIKKAHREAA
jgi:hypothetical protein